MYLEQVTLLYEQAVPAVFANGSLGALIVYVFWGNVPSWAALAWGGLVACALAFSAAVVVMYTRARARGLVTIETGPTWGAWRLAETAVTGLAWGTSAFLLFPFAAPFFKTSLLLILAGFAAGAVPVNAPRIEAYVAYAVPMFGPLLCRLVAEPDYRVIGVFGGGFFLMMILTAFRLTQKTTSALRLQFENWSLERELEYETAERLRAEEQLHLRSKIDVLSESLRAKNEDLTKALRRAEEAAKIKSQFLANMSHELRTPLNAIINIPEGLEPDFVEARVVRCTACDGAFEADADEVIDAATACPACGAAGNLREERRLVFHGDPERTRRYLRSIRQSGKNLLDLVTDLLDFSRIEAGKATLRVEVVSIRALVADLVASLSPLAESKRIALLAAPVDESLTLEADRVKLAQILTNIVGNAIKFSNEDSSIELEVAREDGGVHFRVRDHGIGIAPEHQELIFEAFRQVDGGHTRKFGGSGLGLAITRELVTMHGGTIRVESAIGAGSTFHVVLPPRPPAASEGQRTARVAIPPGAS